MNNDPIEKSRLPQEQLWSIEYAEEMRRKAFYTGIPAYLDKGALLELIKRAWQWDKNAMIQYAIILQSERETKPEKGRTLNDFIIKYREEIVDDKGRLLNEPTVLRIPFWQLMKRLADLKYPYPANRIASSMMGGMGEDNEGNFIPYDRVEADKLSTYIKYSIDGGYRYQEFLADTILYRTGFPSRDGDFNQYFKLSDHLPNLSEDELTEAFDNYKICGLHGSSYCITRLSEGYFYGIGVQKDLVQAYVWAELSNVGYAKYLETLIDPDANIDLFVQKIHRNLNLYNQEVLTKIKAEITPEQLDEATEMLKKIGEQITWDYDKWASGRDPVPPMP